MQHTSYLSSTTWLSLTISMMVYFSVTVRCEEHTTSIRGWTEVNQYWPIEHNEFFVANSKGHHTVEVKLPDNPATDFVVYFEYFYHYERMHPSILVLSCGGEAVPLPSNSQSRNKWMTHEIKVSKEQCANQPTISYSIILHDSRSVFAWKYMRVNQKGVNEELESSTESLPSPTNDQTTVSPPETTPATTGQTNEPPSTEPPTTVAPTTEAPTTKPVDSQTTLPYDTTPLPDNNQLNTTPENNNKASTVSNLHDLFTDYYSTKEPENQNVRRQMTKRILVCRPRSCDLSVFDYSGFRPLINGLPEGATQEELQGDKRLHISNEDGISLNLTIKADNLESLHQIDLCVDFQLYMEPHTQINFELSIGDESYLVLETVKRESGDTTAGKWDRFKRCLSEFIPKLPPSSSSNDNLKLRLVPRSLNHGKRLVCVMLNVATVAFTRKAYQVMEYLPDLPTYVNGKTLEKYWILDKDGLIKPEVQLAQNGATKKLHITQIDSHQTSFDLTSRWLKVNSIDLHDNRFIFTYRLQNADWIKSIDFEFQSSTTGDNKWVTQNIYRAADQIGQSDTQLRLRRPKRDTVDSTSIIDNPLPISAIKIRGLTTDEFRVRLKHYIKPAVADTAIHGSQKELVVDSLAFGDICALGSYCKNNGICKPTGLSTAQCTCPEGFSGDHCEEVHPCDAIYENKKGSELCESIGAKCDPKLPVYRCIWPSDEYLTCKVLYKVDADGHPVDSTARAEAAAESEAKWKEKAESMSRLVVILTVFLIALLLFAFVIVGNLIGKLMKTKNNLKDTRFEMHQINKRSSATSNNQLPTASTSANAPTRFVTSTGIRRPSSGAPTGGGNPVSYNNRSFDSS